MNVARTRWYSPWLAGLQSAIAVLAALTVVGAGVVRGDAAEPWSVADRPLAEALAELAQAAPTSPGPGLGYDVATGPAARIAVTCTLVGSDHRTQTQALAHAAGLWWCPTPHGDELTALRTVPRSTLVVRTHSSALLRDQLAEPLARRLLAPWLGVGVETHAADGQGEGTLSYDPEHGDWTAVLDAAGQSRLVSLLTLLQRPLPQVPDLLPPAGQLPPDLPLAGTLPAGAWAAWCRALSAATASSVSLAPDVIAGAAPEVVLHGTVSDLPALLVASKLYVRAIDQVLCLGRTPPQPRLHPALRCGLAVIPLNHLLPTPEQGATVAQAVAPLVPAEPGWGLQWLPASQSLLIAADPATIHRVLDALDQLDRLGFAAGIAAIIHLEGG